MENMEPRIFNTPRPKKSLLPPPSKKRKVEHKIEEIFFDFDARADYLTGFHKRKVQRAKQAKLEAEKNAKEERIALRKQLREERKQELDEHVEAVNTLLKDVREKSEDEGCDEKLVLEAVDHQEEYVDEDRYTTVTVEAVDISKEGLQKVGDRESIAESFNTKPSKTVEKEGPRENIWPKKIRKKKFRYESKTERKVTRGKQKAGNKARADARKGSD